MSLNPDFSVSQLIGEPSAVIITDDSTGSDVAVTQRRVYLATSQNAFLVPAGTTTDYVEWDIAESEIDIDALGDYDRALRIVVQWLNVSNTVLYSKQRHAGFTSYNEDFDYQLTQMMVANPVLINDNDFYDNKSKLRTLIDSGNQAIERASDIFAAQNCYNLATELREGSQYYFNANS